MNQKPSLIAEKRNILIIFDLDETLVHSTRELPNRKEDFRIGDYYVFKRPFLDSVLTNLSKYFYLAIWSSGTEEYINLAVERIKPPDLKFEFIWSRANCTLRYDNQSNDYYYAKKIDKVKKLGFSKEKILIIEDKYPSVKQNYGNCIIVKPYKGYEDDELLLLNDYLITLKDTQNVLTIEKRQWQSKM
jgi:carboxy-terminal domain RNA polymerase II polypeptide A small phosphatase